MPVRRYTIGLDVGGTNTDCVVLRASEVIGSCKRPTSKNVTSGVHSSLDEALKDASRLTGESVSDIAAHVARVNIGTTHFVNAVVQRKSLARVATIRLCGPGEQHVPLHLVIRFLDKVCVGSCSQINDTCTRFG